MHVRASVRVRGAVTTCALVLAFAFALAAAVALPARAESDPNIPREPDTEVIGTARGVVFHDANGNGARDPGEPGLPGVLVSNQVDVVTTDADGRYEIAVDDDTIIFVVKPGGWQTPVDARGLPRFHYVHKPAGSPPSRFPGVAPTGPLPASIDFPLVPHEEPARFDVLVLGDTQPRNKRELDYVARDIVAPLRGSRAAFGVTLGDLVFDDLALLEPLAETVGTLGIPWYHVIGNHDLNFDAPDHRRSDETYERIFGPSWFAWQVGPRPVHFLAINDVIWHPKKGLDRARYSAGIDPRQMAFLRSYLALVPKDQPIVLLMHIPIVAVENREELFRLLEHRPHTLSFAAHTHYQRHVFVGPEHGWRGQEPHHHVIHATACGDWWHGMPDEQGIPHATMRCGAPNGYSILEIDEEDGRPTYRVSFRGARRPAEEQMSIDAPAVLRAGNAEKRWVYVNVYGGSERSTVEMRLGPDAPWQRLEQVFTFDPQYVRARLREEGRLPPDARAMSGPIDSPHLWRAKIADPLPPAGGYALEVRTRDMHGRVFEAQRPVRVASE